MKNLLALILIFLSSTLFAQTTFTTLQPTGSDPDGTVVNFTWSQISGPNTAAIVTPSSATGITQVNNLIVGVYIFQVVGTDNQGLSAKDQMQVTVNKQNQAPIINAGPDQTIQMPGVSGLNIMNSGQLKMNNGIAGLFSATVSGTYYGPPTAVSITSPFVKNADADIRFIVTQSKVKD